MRNDTRQLCLDYLAWQWGYGRGRAKKEYALLTPEGRAPLLKAAQEWEARGRNPSGLPDFDVPQQPLPSSPPVAAPAAPPERPAVAPEVLATASKVLSKQTASKPAPRAKKVMFSILLPPADLEAMRHLADESGETVAYHVRTAIRRYLKAAEKGEL